ncbi:MAG TPA: glycosyltransferase [Chloroflexaceae bacterium]|nr:glycosyltransferase [Chloroflexaceae bacterium]
MRSSRSARWPDRLAWALALLYGLDRLLRLLALRRFFRRPPPPAPARWPAVTLICPVTRSPNDLRVALEARAALDYPGPLRCLLVCDEADGASQDLCRALMAARPAWRAALILVPPDAGAVASKVAKMRAALPHADGEVLCFVDDDVALRPDALRVLVPYAQRPGVGAAFGLACYTAWGTLAESLMSGFVNTSALPGYVPLALMVEPFTITGHCFAMAREHFDAAGGLEGLEGRFDDDHELARRVRWRGLRVVQTPLIYDVENRLATLADYHAQLRRWVLFPRQAMLPDLSRRERAALALSGLGNYLPPLSALLALATRRPAALASLGLSLGAFVGLYALIERAYLGRPMPAGRQALLPALAVLTPLHVALAALGGETITWRGQRLRVERGGRFTVLGAEET